HTRWPRDWSSDVCSSDLLPLAILAEGRQLRDREPLLAHCRRASRPADAEAPDAPAAVVAVDVAAAHRGDRGSAIDVAAGDGAGEIGRASCRERGERGGGG